MVAGVTPGLQNRRAASPMLPVCSTHTRFRQNKGFDYPANSSAAGHFVNSKLLIKGRCYENHGCSGTAPSPTASAWLLAKLTGNRLILTPVAAKIALATAGATGGTAVSPNPPGG